MVGVSVYCVILLYICSSVYITCLVSAKDVRLPAHIEIVDRQMLALVME